MLCSRSGCPAGHERLRAGSRLATPDRSGSPSNYPGAPMPTRYLIVGALITALVILVGVGVWFLLGVL